MRVATLAALAVLAVIVPTMAPVTAREREELVDQVKNAIDRGVGYLRRTQSARGEWERGGVIGVGVISGGQSCLAMLALLNAGVPPDDPVIQAGLAYIRTIPQAGTYVVALQTMVLAEVNDPRDRMQIQSNVDWLLQAMQRPGFRGWSYGPGLDGGGDFSNTQYALLGLHAGKQAGAKIPDIVWKAILELYKLSQLDTGAWGYTVGDRNPRLTMTLAGFCGLHIAGLELKKGRQKLNRETGVAERCGEYEEDQHIQRTLRWLAQPGHFGFEVANHMYYNVYGVERAGRLSGLRHLAGRDWYREGCEFLIRKQQQDGSWSGGSFDGGTIGATSFALLFLSKGRTPILISKLAWGADNWNNKHHDIKHVVEFCSRELFRKTPLGWQIYDCRKADPNRVRQEAADLLQSPIAFMNGHEPPILTGVQKEILKRYLQEGGFLLAEACCGSADFAAGFRELMKELFDKEMVPVAADHPIYRAYAPIKAEEAAMFPLERLDLGCKTVVILATRPLAGWWEENLFNEGKGVLAFRLAANIVAYATNMELPKPKLTPVEIADDQVDIKLTRNFLEVGQIRHTGDWEPAPSAMRHLMAHLRQQFRLDVSLKKSDVRPGHRELFQHGFLYMHGRGQFSFDATAIKNLRAHLTTGGLLLADACCGSEEFDQSFRKAMQELFPDARLEPIPLGDVLFSAGLNGSAIQQVRCRRRENGRVTELRQVRPELEGVRWGDRWVVIYSKYDLGCALEKHASSDCVGHDHESALRLAAAAVLYYLRY
ncbi:MAG: DUF4159 domain-containing protein [Gemmataceae bacterium]|nr:DUF4159 domain-containing protein [Gemmataceae bacterium]